MTTKNFTNEELGQLREKGRRYILKHKKVFLLQRGENTGFHFVELKRCRRKEGLPYTKKGRYHALNWTERSDMDCIENHEEVMQAR